MLYISLDRNVIFHTLKKQSKLSNFSWWRLNQWLPAFYLVWYITRFASNQFKASSRSRSNENEVVLSRAFDSQETSYTLHITFGCDKFLVGMQATFCLNAATNVHSHFTSLSSPNIISSGGNRNATRPTRSFWGTKDDAGGDARVRRSKRRTEIGAVILNTCYGTGLWTLPLAHQSDILGKRAAFGKFGAPKWCEAHILY